MWHISLLIYCDIGSKGFALE